MEENDYLYFTFEVISILEGSENWRKPKVKPSNEFKLNTDSSVNVKKLALVNLKPFNQLND